MHIDSGNLKRAWSSSIAGLAIGLWLVAGCGTPPPEQSSGTGGTGGSGSGAAGGGGSGGAPASCAPCVWPFDPPPPSELAASPRKVFAHWHWFPLSFDNKKGSEDYYTKAFLDPNGEGGKYYGSGGMIRERPLPRLERPADGWLLADMKREVQLAHEMGIDGFILNMWTDSDVNNGGLWTRWTTLLDAAAEVGADFKIIPSFDASIMKALSEQECSDLMVTMLGKIKSHPSLYKMPDGRLAVGAFAAEARPADFWSGFIARLESDLQIEASFVPTFLGTGEAHLSSFAPFSGALSGWGTAIPTDPANRKKLVDTVKGLGSISMPPVNNQDFRPASFKYWEASNTLTLRTSWESTIDAGAEWAQIATWNDFLESHAIQPSTGKQWATYDLMAFYITWFKTGKAPTIARDALYYSHRIHSTQAAPDLTKQTKPMEITAGQYSPAKDEVEVLAFLTAPGTLQIELGGKIEEQDAPAGITAFRVPLATGRPVFRLLRAGEAVIELQSDFDIRAPITFQDLAYRSGGSLRHALGAEYDCKALCEAGNLEGCLACPSEPVWLVANPP
ncbi:glycoside hydrolase family 71 protein [Polyangium aurulentum]|uniref:glycoside hydrolase family 71 protein n=1 Tax=Polyangium aurulentum TaxID=2567896 RepID=UPI0010ADDA69|nr:glycoside hydrolase family 71 protein [Polyangium aurulentum]UQA59809.1 hypothetical protein E8A73_004720 [Polyangium aurulentum]